MGAISPKIVVITKRINMYEMLRTMPGNMANIQKMLLLLECFPTISSGLAPTWSLLTRLLEIERYGEKAPWLAILE